MMRPDPDTKEFEVVSLHPGVTPRQVRERTGWPVRFAATVEETPAPSAAELDALRDLHARTARAHHEDSVSTTAGARRPVPRTASRRWPIPPTRSTVRRAPSRPLIACRPTCAT